MKHLAIRSLVFAIATLFLSGAAASADEISILIDGGTLSLVGGVPRTVYWPSGYEGKMADWMADSLFQARAWMTAHDGDWCCFKLALDDTATYVIDSLTSIGIVLANGDTVPSTQVLVANNPLETRFWTASDGVLIFKNGACPYGRSLPPPHRYVIYVRFPEKSCLSDIADDQYRRFKADPVAIWVKRR